MISTASTGSVDSETTFGSAVIHSRTRASLEWTRPATARVRSRSVTIPIRRPPSETTIALTPSATIFSAAWPIVSNGSIVITSRDMTSLKLAMLASILAGALGAQGGLAIRVERALHVTDVGVELALAAVDVRLAGGQLGRPALQLLAGCDQLGLALFG